MRAAFIVGLAAIVALGGARTTWDMLDASYTFDKYCAEFGRGYEAGSEEYSTRRALFETNLRRILAHNADSSKSWKEGVNQFTDRTVEEYRAMLGYKKAYGFKARGNGLSAPSMPAHAAEALLKTLPDSVDWRTKGAVTPVKNQGNCGSCWTFAAAETLESAWFLKTGNLDVLSEQQFASCTSNPQHCGGTGGCEGGTAEVAYATAITFGGVASEAEYPYKSGGGTDYPCIFNNKTTPPVAHIKSYVTLPSNEAVPLLNAVATVGPIAISVDASSWGAYESGIYNGCSKTNIDLDHAVQLVGYGTDAGQDYWLVRNSWSASWGENGYIRVFRGSASNPSCGTDYAPQDGSGCDNGPSTITACGTCGILYDNCYPVV